MIYLDNAATTLKKPKQVINEVLHCIKYYSANPGRSGHYLSKFAAEKVFEARDAISDFLKINKPEGVCFSQNATTALNTVIKGLIKEKCHIISSDIEHNSVIRPLEKLKKTLGVEISYFDSDLPIDFAVTNLIRADTKAIIVNLMSNVTGKALDIDALVKIKKKYKLVLVADTSQYLGHLSLDLTRSPIDIICCTGHKSLFGIQGVGFFVINSDTLLDTLNEGGSGSEAFNTEMPMLPPERYEAGTLPTPSIVSVLEGIKFIKETGIDKIEKKINALCEKTNDILSSIKDVTLYSCKNGIALFNFKDYSSSDITELLSDKGIAVRGGVHCAPLIHEKLKTDNRGAVRVSLSYFNTEKELDALYRAIKSI